jgi:hypothetical protein
MIFITTSAKPGVHSVVVYLSAGHTLFILPSCIPIINRINRADGRRDYTQRSVTVFSSRKSFMESIRDFDMPKKESFFDPSPKKA